MSKKWSTKSDDLTLNGARSRIKDLEKENNTLKNRLDELRRAKQQTVLKKEGSTVAKGPSLGRKGSRSDHDSSPDSIQPSPDPKLEEELAALKQDLATREEHIRELKQSHESALSAAKTAMRRDLESLRDSHVAELERLAREYAADLGNKEAGIKRFQEEVMKGSSSSIDDLMSIIAALKAENIGIREENELKSVGLANLEGRIKDLLTELSEKEAAWCEVEEKLKVQIQKTWGEKYQAWMLATEKKIEELRQTNDVLKAALERNGLGPT